MKGITFVDNSKSKKNNDNKSNIEFANAHKDRIIF